MEQQAGDENDERLGLKKQSRELTDDQFRTARKFKNHVSGSLLTAQKQKPIN